MTHIFRLATLLLACCPASAQVVNSPGGTGASGLVAVGGNGSCCGGATTETNILALKIPAGSMGATGMINVKCLYGYTNSANNKVLTVRFTATSGAVGGGNVAGVVTLTTTTASQTEVNIRNTATNVQTAYSASSTTPFGSSASAAFAQSVDTTADSYVNINGQTALGSETITAHCVALILKSP